MSKKKGLGKEEEVGKYQDEFMLLFLIYKKELLVTGLSGSRTKQALVSRGSVTGRGGHGLSIGAEHDQDPDRNRLP